MSTLWPTVHILRKQLIRLSIAMHRPMLINFLMPRKCLGYITARWSPWQLMCGCCWWWSHLLVLLSIRVNLRAAIELVVMEDCWEDWKGPQNNWWTISRSCWNITRQFSIISVSNYVFNVSFLKYVMFFSRPRSESWPHHGHTFSIYLCPLSFWSTLLWGVLSTSCPSRPCVVFLACVHLALLLALSLSPVNSPVTVIAELKQQISQKTMLLLQHSYFLAMWCRSSIIFCDICCFSYASRPYKAL